jgi:uncharacterized cupredoxin-like copper-binding protein
MRLAAILLCALLGACGTTSGYEKPTTTAVALPDDQGVQKLEVEAHSYYFEPNRLVVRAGQPVELKVHNEAAVVPHNMTIEGIDVAVDVGGKGTANEYHIHCDVGDHAEHGMLGTLVVLPADDTQASSKWPYD